MQTVVFGKFASGVPVKSVASGLEFHSKIRKILKKLIFVVDILTT